MRAKRLILVLTLLAATLTVRANDTPLLIELDRRSEALVAAVNATGRAFLSHTRLDGRFTIRVAIGNLRTEPEHLERTWALLREAASGSRT